jgi:hypothetical protein
MRRAAFHSTLVQAATYQDQFAVLELEFSDGAVYRYFQVPAQVYEDLLSAESKGGYFNRCIRTHFAYAAVPANADHSANRRGK